MDAGTKATLTILVAKDSLGKAIFAHVVLQKGVDPAYYAVDALVKDVAWLGYTRFSLRSDNEPAILLLLKHALTEARFKIEQLEQVVQEHPNAYDHAANGEIESTVKQVTASSARTNWTLSCGSSAGSPWNILPRRGSSNMPHGLSTSAQLARMAPWRSKESAGDRFTNGCSRSENECTCTCRWMAQSR